MDASGTETTVGILGLFFAAAVFWSVFEQAGSTIESVR